MNPWRGLGSLPRNMWIIFFAALINRTGTMVLPFLAIYLTQKMGQSPAGAGLVITFYGLGAFISAPFIGRLSDKVGALRVMTFSLILSAIVLFIYPFLKTYTLILFLTLLLSIISEAFRPSSMSLISETVSAEFRRPAFSLNRLAINLGMSIGPVVGGFLAVAHFNLIFYVDGITSILAGIFLIFAPWNPKPSVYVNNKTDLSNGIKPNFTKLSLLKDRRLFYFLIAILPVPIVYLQHQAAMPLFLVRNLHFSPSTYGILFTINTVLIILVEVPLNNYFRHWSDRKTLTIGALLSGIGFGSMAFAASIGTLVVSIIIWTFGEMITFPACSAYMSEIAPENRRGEYMGIYQMTFSFAFTIGPWLGTLVLENYGPFILWMAAFVLCSISSLMLLRLKRTSSSKTLSA
jgi:MFS family permease